MAALLVTACSDSRTHPIAPAPLSARAAQEKPKTVTVPVDFVKGDGAHVSDDGIDSALAEINKVFERAGIKFTRNTVSTITDPTVPKTPTDNGPNAPLTDEERKVAEAGEKSAKEQPNNAKLTVVIVEDFKGATPHQKPAAGKTVVGKGPVLIADPFRTEARSLGMVPFWVVLAHELGHALGLTHKVLDSDKNYANQQNGQYKAPNLMGNPEDKDSTELTEDQIKELRKGAQRFK
ncbi:MAG: hypothetical protein M3068_06525 [Gemmatimonadota bacterium]|nr:hypothetical protein [Gemmatimonadota bacterium]